MSRKAASSVLIGVVIIGMLLIAVRRWSQPSSYKVGALLALSGRGSTYGKRALKGMQLAVEEANKK
jgi:ABC-type branched-subunit amino acid transport system substrate-binding protein